MHVLQQQQQPRSDPDPDPYQPQPQPHLRLSLSVPPAPAQVAITDSTSSTLPSTLTLTSHHIFNSAYHCRSNLRRGRGRASSSSSPPSFVCARVYPSFSIVLFVLPSLSLLSSVIYLSTAPPAPTPHRQILLIYSPPSPSRIDFSASASARSARFDSTVSLSPAIERHAILHVIPPSSYLHSLSSSTLLYSTLLYPRQKLTRSSHFQHTSSSC